MFMVATHFITNSCTYLGLCYCHNNIYSKNNGLLFLNLYVSTVKLA